MGTQEKKTPRKQFWQILMWVGIVVLVLAGLTYFGIGFYAAGSLTQPRRQFDPTNNPGAYQLAYEDVRIPASDGKAELASWFIPHANSSRVILMVHGNNASRTREFDDEFPRMAAALHEMGFNVLMIDLRGHGESSAARVSFGLLERYDVVGAVDWLVEQGFNPGSIGVLGISLGSASSIGGVTESPAVGALVIESAFADIYPVIRAQWPTASGLPNLFLTPTRWMIRLRYGYDIASSRPVEEIGAIEQPILLIHCKTDADVPFEHALELAKAASHADTWYLDGCEHARAYNFGMTAYENRVGGFFNQYLK
jgi:dipeptidyl aminopeptidase/acylaminoacyl peptidase